MTKILLVDDNATDLFILKHSLKRSGRTLELIEFMEVSQVFEYLDKLIINKGELPRLVITDLNMPGKNGFDLIKYIISSKKLRDIPIVMLSSSTTDSDIKQAYELGVYSFVRKPMTPETIQHIVDMLGK